MPHRGRKDTSTCCGPKQCAGGPGQAGKLHSRASSFDLAEDKKSFWRRYPWLIWLLPVIGLVSLIWFLIRVVPKPSRATYPCQRLAAPLASGFIIWITGLIGSALAYRKARRLIGRSRYVVGGICAALAVTTIWVCLSVTGGRAAQAAAPHPVNSPIGVGKGVFPGRVVWVHDANATDKQYSRNLGTGNGIELVTQNQLWASADGPIRNMTRGRRYDFIQYAINDARDGDEIVVPEDVYEESISLGGKNVTVRSSDPNDPVIVAATVINGIEGAAVVTLQAGEDANCALSGLTITGGDVGVYCSGATPTISNCVIAANAGPGVKAWNFSNPTIIASSIVDNAGDGVEVSFGRGITSHVTIINTTIVGNSGAGILSGIVTVANSIIYYNDGDQIAGDATVTYSDVQGGYPGQGNLDCDPCFADPCNGDYHLKSENGRWHPLSQSWVFDDVTSLCIDGGDPASEWRAELWPHGECINMGRYGGTPEASMSRSPAGNAADLDFDNDVDFRDFDDFVDKWRAEEIFLPEDIDRNGLVDFFDVKMFVDEWLWRK